jgi:thiosulfate reductase cytochrome b subunit
VSPQEVIYRHSSTVRVTHWVNVVALLVLLMSGLQIFNAHPSLYLGAKSNFDDPVMAMRPIRHGEEIVGVTTIAGWNIDTTNLFGLAYTPDGGYEVRGFPWSVTLPGHRDLSTGRRWHFFLARLFVIIGLIYLIYSLAIAASTTSIRRTTHIEALRFRCLSHCSLERAKSPGEEDECGQS